MLAIELHPAVITGKGLAVEVRSDVGLEVVLTDEGAFTQGTLVRFGHARSVSPSVQVEVPLGVKLLATDNASELLDGPMLLHVSSQGSINKRHVTNRADDVFLLDSTSRKIFIVVSFADVPCETRTVDVSFTTVHALLGFFIVGLFVPLQLLF